MHINNSAKYTTEFSLARGSIGPAELNYIHISIILPRFAQKKEVCYVKFPSFNTSGRPHLDLIILYRLRVQRSDEPIEQFTAAGSRRPHSPSLSPPVSHSHVAASFEFLLLALC